jgi:iron complex outermembrane receptor protein
MTKKQLLLLAFLLCKQLTLFSQYTISGTVKDENGNALAGANVLIEKSVRGTTTDKNGTFVIPDLEKGDYTLSISFIGYEKTIKPINVQGTTHIDIVLQNRSYLADDVIITAVRATDNMPVTKSIITKTEIKQQNLGQDVPYLLTMSPSLITSSDAGAGVGYTSFRIRGTDVSRINVTVNGIPLNDAESHGVWWVDLPDFASSVENIQIQRGVGTSTQGGGAFGATINLQTLSLNKKAYAEIANSFGSFNTLKHCASFGSGLINDHFTFDGRVSRITSDGYIDRAWSKLKSYYLSGAYYSENTLIKVNIFSGLENTYQAWDGVPSDILKTNRRYNGIGAYTDAYGQQKYYDNETDNYQQDYYQMHISHAINNNLKLNLSGFYTLGKGYYEQYKEEDDLMKYQLNNVIIGGDTITTSDIIRRKWLDNDFYGTTWSLNYTKSSINAILGGGWNQYYGEHYGRVRWAQFMSNGELDHQYYYSNGTKNDFNIFGKVTYSISDKLSFFGDIQFRRITHKMKGVDDKLQYDGNLRNIAQDHEFNFVNPKAGINFSLSEMQTMYAFAGIAHREPTRSNFVDSDPSKPTPKAEKLLDFELGYNFKSNNSEVGINFYYMDYNDQLVHTGMINDVGAAIMTNVPSSYRAGIEITGGLKLVDYVSWNGNATFSKNMISEFTEYIDNWDTWGQESFQHTNNKLPFSPEIIAASQFTINRKPLSVSLISKYVGKQYIDNTESEERKLDSYFINDVRAMLSFSTKYISKIDFIISINNIFNEKYETNAWVYQYYEENALKKMDGYYPQATRNYLIGMTLNF